MFNKTTLEFNPQVMIHLAQMLQFSFQQIIIIGLYQPQHMVPFRGLPTQIVDDSAKDVSKYCFSGTNYEYFFLFLYHIKLTM